MILIVDGDTHAGARLERVLKYRGLQSLALADGMEVLALIDLRTPDLIVLELQIQGMDGIVLMRGIRKDPKFDRVPIVIYTSQFDDTLRRTALLAGAQDFIVKGTVGWEALIERIGKFYHR